MRARSPASSFPGNIIFPAISSKTKRGYAFPRIWLRPSWAISAARIRDAAPMLFACAFILSSWSSGISRRICPASPRVDPTTMRSRIRSNKSWVNLRGSSPASITLSMVLNKVETSRAAIASIDSSRSAPSVYPRSETAIS